jgi:putative oxidoreductase
VASDIGRLILRVALGVLVLLHGIHKLQDGVGGIAGLLNNAGLPGILAYGAYLGEVIAPILVILGFYSRTGAWVMAINMLFAVGLAHMGEVPKLTEMGGWALELQGHVPVYRHCDRVDWPGKVRDQFEVTGRGG